MRHRRQQLRSILRSALIVERDYGHVRSLLRQESVDRDDEPIPWYTYAAIAWLKNLDFSGVEVFEFGSGNSTTFWASRARTVASVEDDAEWHARVSRGLPSNASCTLIPGEDEYVAACSSPCDVVNIDGSYRLACARASVARVRPGGMMVLDNSDWFPNTATFLRDAGLTQVDFIGMGPINPYAWATSVFLRDGGRQLAHKGPFEVHSGMVQQSGADW
jgi:hypothetical protein